VVETSEEKDEEFPREKDEEFPREYWTLYPGVGTKPQREV